jgi:signal peptidase II
MRWLLFGVFACWLGLDQISKLWTVAHIPVNQNPSEYLTFIPGFLSLTHVHNTGAAWSLFSSMTPVLVVFRCLVGGLALIWAFRHVHQYSSFQVTQVTQA